MLSEVAKAWLIEGYKGALVDTQKEFTLDEWEFQFKVLAERNGLTL